MWMCTPGGVYMPGLIPPNHIPADQPDRVLQVRTRRRIDLERLRDIYMGDTLGEILESPGMDYNFRAYCSLEAWATACYNMAMDIDYIKFKEQSEKKFPGPDGKLLHDVYTSMWGTLTRLGRPYAGSGTTPMFRTKTGHLVPEQPKLGFSDWDYAYDHDTFFSTTAANTQKAKPIKFPARSDSEKALDLLDALDGKLITTEECWAELARLPESAWGAFVKPYEREQICSLQQVSHHRKAKRFKKNRQKAS